MVSKIRWQQVGSDEHEHRVSVPTAVPAKKKPFMKFACIILAVLLCVGLGVFGYEKYSKKQPVKNSYFPSYITKDQVAIPVYYPIHLPKGYKVSDFKVVKKNILIYKVTNAKSEEFYVSLQPLATSFDFVGFKKKFVKPDEYSTPIGNNLVGVTGTDLIGSIQTTNNVWIIINSKALNSIKDMETITRSLQKVQL